MEAILDQRLQTTDTHELRQFLDARLTEDLPGKASRAKAIGILLWIWSGNPQKQLAIRDRAIELLPTMSLEEPIAPVFHEFESAFSRPTWSKVQVRIIGTL
jgi:hypothetical protein